MRSFKQLLEQEQQSALNDKQRAHRHKMIVKMRQFKRQKLLGQQQMDQNLLREVSETGD